MRRRRSEDRELVRKMKTSENKAENWRERTTSEDAEDEIGKLGREEDTEVTN